MVAATSAMHAPFLDGQKAGCGADDPRRKTMVQRAAGLHWPDPTGALLLLTGLAGCACLTQRTQGEDVPGLAISLSAANPGQSTEMGGGTLLLILAGVLLLVALVSQVVFEKLLARAATQAVQSWLLKCSDFPVELGRMRLWVFLGRMEIRNCSMRNPSYFKSNTMLHLRTLTVDFNVPRCLRALLTGGVPEIRSLKLNGVALVVEKHGVAGGQSNLQQAISQLEGAITVGAKPSLSIRQVSVKDVVASEVDGRGRAALADIERVDSSCQDGVSSVDQALLALLKQLDTGFAAMG